MGILDELRLTAVKLFNRNVSNTPPDTNGNRYSYDMGFAKAVAQTGDAFRSSRAEKLKEYVSDPDHREKIGRIISGIGKFAVDSAVNESLKGVTGGIQVYKIVKEGLKDQPLPLNPNESEKPELTAVMEEMQARMEKMQEEMNTTKQQSKISMESAKGSEPLKEFPDEPIKGSAPLKTDPKRVFIRSRL